MTTENISLHVGDFVTLSDVGRDVFGNQDGGKGSRGVVVCVLSPADFFDYKVKWDHPSDYYTSHDALAYRSVDLQPWEDFSNVAIDNNAPVANIAKEKSKTALADAITFLESGLQTQQEKTMTTPDTSSTPAPTGTFTFETKLDNVVHVGFTRANPGAVGWVVLRKKQRGRPTYFGVTAAVPADAMAFDGELHPLAVNVLNAGG